MVKNKKTHNSRHRAILNGFVVLVIASLMVPTVTAATPPSGNYLRWDSRHIVQYDNSTSVVTDTGITTSSVSYVCNNGSGITRELWGGVYEAHCGDCYDASGNLAYVPTWTAAVSTWTSQGTCINLKSFKDTNLVPQVNVRNDLRIYDPAHTIANGVQIFMTTRAELCGIYCARQTGVNSYTPALEVDKCLPGDISYLYACAPKSANGNNLTNFANVNNHQGTDGGVIRTLVFWCGVSPGSDPTAACEDDASHMIAISWIESAF